ncbi:DUF5058 family protein [Brevibacterium album]|uniref:DUF5058 family protein n=1 Tax=Brevibacterium album TaxID=417948 RepID=UPI000416E54F|nr:DUF5058 family protein [Brevibacterium album]
MSPQPLPASASPHRSPDLLASTDVPGLANTPILWILALAVLSVVGIQSAIYMVAVRRNAEAADMSPREVNRAFRAGGIAAIGPSLAVVLVAVALLPLFGTPPVLVRIGLIGSAATEVASAELAAQTMGSGLSGDGYTTDVFVVALMAMSLSGAGWMLATLILTPVLKTGSAKLQKVNPALMSIVPGAALLAAFAALAMTELPKSGVHAVAVAVSAVIMAVCLLIANRLRAAWLKEWALGFAIVGALTVAYFVHHAG